MLLPVIEPDRLDPVIALKRPSEAGGGILSAGEKDEGCGSHSRFIAVPMPIRIMDCRVGLMASSQ
jgi:hypothetical protein